MGLWKKYAIDPSLFSNYHLASAILSDIGIERGRIVGALPPNWQKEILGNTRGLKELERKKIVERLLEIKSAIVRKVTVWDSNIPWVQHAIAEHQISPFDGLLVNGTAEHPAAIDATLGLINQPIWNSACRVEVPRKTESLVSALAHLLGQVREIMIVDAHFNPSVPNSKWLRPLRGIALALPKDGRLTRFEVHALDSHRDRWRPGVFVRHCRNNLCNTMPKGLIMKVFLWSERIEGPQFHERLILTDIGGIDIDPGIDEGQGVEIYRLQLLSNSVLPSYFDKFDPSKSPYNLVDQVEVEGAWEPK